MQNPGGESDWGYHVATAAFVDGYGWMVVDTFPYKIQSVQHWYNQFAVQSIDGKPRLYVTRATRFGISLEKYSRLHLGLELDLANDWFKHYFVDALSWLRATNLRSIGLETVKPADRSTPSSESLDASI